MSGIAKYSNLRQFDMNVCMYHIIYIAYVLCFICCVVCHIVYMYRCICNICLNMYYMHTHIHIYFMNA